MVLPLAERIAAARHELTAHDARRRESGAMLDRLLSAVERRFAARTIERDEVRARLDPLAEANRGLAALVDRLAVRVDRTAAAERDAAARLAAGLGNAMHDPGAWRFEDVSAEELHAEEGAASF